MDLTLDYLTQHFQLAVTSTQPIYTQLADYLRHLIQSGVLLPGDKMLGENDIVQGLKISRTTVRQAMNQLVDEGLLIRLRGKGSFVAEQQLHRSINYLYSFTENILSSGAVPTSVVVNAELIDADNATAKILSLHPENRKVFFLKRLRLANQAPLILESTYIPYYLCPNIEKVDFAYASLYQTLENNYGIRIDWAKETIEAIIIGDDDAKSLRCHSGMPAYKIQRISYLNTGYVCEYTSSVTRADKCVFQLDLRNAASSGKGINIERSLKIPDIDI